MSIQLYFMMQKRQKAVKVTKAKSKRQKLMNDALPSARTRRAKKNVQTSDDVIMIIILLQFLFLVSCPKQEITSI